ncbi:MAG: tetratricopeptide repeat protein, partial [Planctomycetota bacterium]
MDNTETEKTTKTPSKSFMTAGPALHYSHKNVQRAWLLAFITFGLSCIFWPKLLTGSFRVFDLAIITSPRLWGLHEAPTAVVSIFEYPWQIFVLGLLMGTLTIVPVLISQLMCASYSIPFVLAVAFLANLPGLAVSLLLSCIAVACRPLRFRSRFTSIALCMAPQLIYWGFFGGGAGQDPIKWGFSFTPWIYAWLTGLAAAGIVLGIGHFTRYKPGLVWIVTSALLLTALTVFDVKIGFDELDYQLYVAKNNPEHVAEFHSHSITEALDKTITNPSVTKYLADFYFYPAEPIPLRKELKKEIVEKLTKGRWPNWLILPDELKFQAKSQWLSEQYDSFISLRPRSSRMPIALYYKALLNEYSPDIVALKQKEELVFHNDYPHEDSLETWHSLYRDFGQSPESIEARWRIAKDWAGKGRFERAAKLLSEAQDMAVRRLKLLEEKQPPAHNTFFSPFQPPAGSVMTAFKLTELQRRLNQLISLISSENRRDTEASAERLARFVRLNPHASGYSESLDKLLEEISNDDPLADNVLLAQIKLVADEQLRAKNLSQLHQKFPDSDGGMQALYELGLLKLGLWRQLDDSNVEQKKKTLTEARAVLTMFLRMYPDGTFAEQVKKNLEA